jgi:hypothetical protein
MRSDVLKICIELMSKEYKIEDTIKFFNAIISNYELCSNKIINYKKKI